MDTFHAFLEAMIEDGVLERLSDAGAIRLAHLYQTHQIPLPADLLGSLEARGIIIQN